jgi:hypothetical protein
MLMAAFVQGAGAFEAIRVEIGCYPTAKFDPHEALGAGLDGHWQGETGPMLSPPEREKDASGGPWAGFHPTSH